MRCAHCQSLVADRANFCQHCGAHVVRESHHLEEVTYTESSLPEWHDGWYEGTYTFEDGTRCAVRLSFVAYLDLFEKERQRLLDWLDAIGRQRQSIAQYAFNNLTKRGWDSLSANALLSQIAHIHIQKDTDWCADVNYQRDRPGGRDFILVRVDSRCTPQRCFP